MIAMQNAALTHAMRQDKKALIKVTALKAAVFSGGMSLPAFALYWLGPSWQVLPAFLACCLGVGIPFIFADHKDYGFATDFDITAELQKYDTAPIARQQVIALMRSQDGRLLKKQLVAFSKEARAELNAQADKQATTTLQELLSPSAPSPLSSATSAPNALEMNILNTAMYEIVLLKGFAGIGNKDLAYRDGDSPLTSFHTVKAYEYLALMENSGLSEMTATRLQELGKEASALLAQAFPPKEPRS